MGLTFTGFTKISFLDRFFVKELYTAADMEKAYHDGQLLIGNNIATTHIEIIEHNDIINKLEASISIANTKNVDLQTKLDSCKSINTELTKNLTKVNKDLDIKKDAIVSYINEIKVLNTAISDLKQKHINEVNKVLKDCADAILKNDNKKLQQPISTGGKLTCAEVNDIRTSILSIPELTTKYNVNKSIISRIKNKKIYKQC